MALYGNGGRALRNAADWARMLAHGACVMAVPALAVWWLGAAWWWPLVAMLATPGTAWLANRWPWRIGWLGCTAGDPGPTGELLVGALWGAALAGGIA
jgi:hypothetical protein